MAALPLLLPGEERVAVAALARPRCSPARRGSRCSRRSRPVSGFPSPRAVLRAAPRVAGGQSGPRGAGPPRASPCGPGRAALGRAASEGPPAAGSAGGGGPSEVASARRLASSCRY